MSSSPRTTRTPRFGLIPTAFSPLLAHVAGSIFNIWYNLKVLLPLLDASGLHHRFVVTCIAYNAIVYPLGLWIWLRAVYQLRPAFQELRAGATLDPERLLRCRRRLIHLPWLGALISGCGWLFCIPAFLLSLAAAGHGLNRMLLWHLPISFLVSACISMTHGFFLIELTSHRTLFPVFFSDVRPDLIPGAHSLSLRGRGILWAVSAGICPIGSLLMLSFAPAAPGANPAWFATFVGAIGVAFGLCTALMIGRLVVEPIDQLREAAQAVAQGRLDIQIPGRRADEFGLLAGEFNHMVYELREKERLRQTFGLHVGRRAAEQILAHDPGLTGVERVISIIFVDIRSFSKRSLEAPPRQVVWMLNEFLRVMVHIVEEGGGMINKFLGDGFIALFGIGEKDEAGQADRAVAVGLAMLRALPELNAALASKEVEPIVIGVGIHTGPAIVGSIGTPERLEFTAIGASVNLAARIEGLTKSLGAPLLVSEATLNRLTSRERFTALPPQRVKGFDEPIAVFAPSADL
jgi:adenylate cyclase